MNEHLGEKFVFKNDKKQYQLKIIHINSNISFRVDDENSSPKKIYKDNYCMNDFWKFDNFFYSFETIKNIYLYIIELCKENKFCLSEKENQMLLSFKPNQFINEIKIPLNLSDAYFDTMFNSLYDSYKKLKEEIASLKIENLKMKIQSCSTPQGNQFVIKEINEISFEIISKFKRIEKKEFNINDFNNLNSKFDIENDSSDIDSDNDSDIKIKNNLGINLKDEAFFNELFKKMAEDNKNNNHLLFVSKLNQYYKKREFSSFILIMIKNMKNDDKYISSNINLLKILSSQVPFIKNKMKKENPITIGINNSFWFKRWLQCSFDNIKDYENYYIGVAKFIGELAKNLLLHRIRFPLVLEHILKKINGTIKKEEYEILINVFLIVCKSFIVCQNKYDNIKAPMEYQTSMKVIENKINNFLNINKVQSANINIQIEIKNFLILKKNCFDILSNNNKSQSNSNYNNSINQINNINQNINNSFIPMNQNNNTLNNNYMNISNPVNLYSSVPVFIPKINIPSKNIINNVIPNNDNNNNQIIYKINNQNLTTNNFNKTGLNNNNNQINMNQLIINTQKEPIANINSNNNIQNNKEEILNEYIIEDLECYISFLDSGGRIEDYEWKTITDLYNNKKYEISEIYNSYILATLSTVKNKNVLSYSNIYMREIIYYYAKIVNKNQKKEIKKVIVSYLKDINFFYGKNIYIIDILANSIFSFVKYEYIKYNDIHIAYNKTEDCNQYFILLKKIYLIDGETNTLKTFRKFDFVRKNQHIFEKILYNNSNV